MDQELYAWFLIKEKMRGKKQYPFFHEREVWMASWGINVGHEQNGRGSRFLRPVLVLKKLNSTLLWGVPFTSKQKEGRYYMLTGRGKKVNTVILSQIKTFDARRLWYRIGRMQKEEYEHIRKRIKDFLGG